MSPQTGQLFESSDGEIVHLPAPAEDRTNEALGTAVMALANLDRAIRGLPFVTVVTDLHPDKIVTFLKRAREIALAEHPDVALAAVAAGGHELHEFIDRLITDPEAAIVNDPERMKDATQAIMRKVIDTYRHTLYAALPDVRAAQGRG